MAVFYPTESGDDAQINLTQNTVGIAAVSYYVGNLLTDNDREGAGLRFRNLTIKPGSTILSAIASFKASVGRTAVTVNTIFWGDKDTTPPVYSDWADYAARVKTDVSVDWDAIPAWTNGETYTSPELKTIIQEIIGLPGWASGNDLAIFWLDDGSTNANLRIRNFYGWDSGDGSDAAFITITWTEPEVAGGGGGPAALLIAQGTI